MITFSVLDDARLLALHDGDGRICRTQIDTDDGALYLLSRILCISSYER